MFLVATIIVLITLLWWWSSITKPKNYPPGPAWQPILGSFNTLKEYARKYGSQQNGLHEMHKKWNSQVLGLKLGGENVIYVEGYEIIRDILTSEEYDQRPTNYFIKLRTLGTYKGITCAEGPFWLEQRNFAIRQLRNVGVGKNALDVRIYAEIEDMMKIIDTQKETQIATVLPCAIINILWSLVAGNHVVTDTLKPNRLISMIRQRVKAFDMSGGLLAQYPWMRYIIPETTGYSLITKLNGELKEFLLETIADHHTKWTKDSDEDFIYTFITEMKKQNSKATTFTDEQLLLVCLDLFVGGFSTTSNTLDFFFLLMLHYQDVQKKIQELIDANFTKNQRIEYQDRYKIPYVEAVVKEVQRFRNITPIIGPRRNKKETKILGYAIPKDSTILLNLHSTYMSKKIWGDPETFRPERFLNEKEELISHPEFIPFGLGKRKCLGDGFARPCLFIFAAEILRNYSILPVDKNNLPSLTPVGGIMLTPQPYLARFIKRY